MTDDELETLLRSAFSKSDNELEKLSDEDSDDFWRIFEMPKEDPDLCWRLLEVARERNFSNEQLAVISAGPFEDLMGHHGEQFIDRVETAARRDVKMRYLLGTVWQGRMSDATWKRLLQIRSELGIRQL